MSNSYTRRRHLLVCYDIADDKRRTAVFETLRDHGNHVQFSVFLCQLDQRETVDLKRMLSDFIHHLEDQVMFVDLGPATHDLHDQISTLGQAYAPPGKRFIV